MQAALLPLVPREDGNRGTPIHPQPLRSAQAATSKGLPLSQGQDSQSLAEAPSKIEKRTQCQHLPKKGVCDLSG